MKRRKVEGIEFTDDVPEQIVKEEIEFQKKVIEDHYRSRFTIAEGHDLLKIREENEALKQKVKDHETFLQKLRIYVLEREYDNSLLALKEVNRDMRLKIGGRREAYNNIIEYIKERTDE